MPERRKPLLQRDFRVYANNFDTTLQQVGTNFFASIDFLKGRVAFDLEWNSKDQTFDRDLLAMRTYYDCDIVSDGLGGWVHIDEHAPGNR